MVMLEVDESASRSPWYWVRSQNDFYVLQNHHGVIWEVVPAYNEELMRESEKSLRASPLWCRGSTIVAPKARTGLQCVNDALRPYDLAITTQGLIVLSTGKPPEPTKIFWLVNVLRAAGITNDAVLEKVTSYAAAGRNFTLAQPDQVDLERPNE